MNSTEVVGAPHKSNRGGTNIPRPDGGGRTGGTVEFHVDRGEIRNIWMDLKVDLPPLASVHRILDEMSSWNK